MSLPPSRLSVLIVWLKGKGKFYPPLLNYGDQPLRERHLFPTKVKLSRSSVTDGSSEHHAWILAAEGTFASGPKWVPHTQLVQKQRNPLPSPGLPSSHGITVFLADQVQGWDKSFPLSLPSVSHQNLIHGTAYVSCSQTWLRVRIPRGDFKWIQIWGPISGGSESVDLEVAWRSALKVPFPCDQGTTKI